LPGLEKGRVVMIEIYVGRMPIYTPSLDVFGFKLLYRVKDNTKILIQESEKATSEIIFNTFIEIGLEKIAEDKLAFITIDNSYLTEKLPLPFPKEQIVLVIPKWVPMNNQTIAAIKRLKAERYWLCLEDRLGENIPEDVCNLVNIIKIDIQEMKTQVLHERVDFYRTTSARLMASKVQSQEDFEICKDIGFNYYEGYFLAKPRIVLGRRLPTNRFSLLKLLSCLFDPEADMGELEELIRQDISLSYRLLRMVNSAYYALDTKVESIRHALVILGLKQIREWLTILAMADVNDRSTTLMTTAMIRGKMCELLAVSAGFKQEDRFFTVGLLSILDAIMDLSMEEVLQNLPLLDDMNQALLTQTGPMGYVLSCVLAYENGEWNKVDLLKTNPVDLRDAYLRAISWASETSRKIHI
jgi:EAL and modified HD-GYP domain-containing signal transduction protein